MDKIFKFAPTICEHGFTKEDDILYYLSGCQEENCPAFYSMDASISFSGVRA
jgi:hypothetical protein